LFGVDAHIDQLHHLLNDTLKIDKPIHILGHSMGGALVTLFTCKYPAKVKSLTLFSPAGLMNSGALPVIRNVGFARAIVRNMLGKKKNQQDAWRKDFHNHTGVFLEREEASVQRMNEQYENNPQWFNAFFQSVLQFPLYGLTAEVKTLSEINDLPIHLVWGKNDPTVPFKPDYQRWKTALEAGKCRFSTFTIDKAAHAFFLEHPDEVNTNVLEFLQTVKNGVVDGQV
jgi:pimeloyl-ACP methyl ester carboxylesterase